jgi:hypothetical protein
VFTLEALLFLLSAGMALRAILDRDAIEARDAAFAGDEGAFQPTR